MTLGKVTFGVLLTLLLGSSLVRWHWEKLVLSIADLWEEHLIHGDPWESHLNFLDFVFLICKWRIIDPISKDYWKD